MNDHVFMVAHRFEKDEWPRFYRLDFNGSKGGGSAGALIYDHYIESLLPITGCLYRSATYFNGVVFYAKVLIQDGFRYDISYDIYNPLSRCKSTVRPITPFLHGDPVLLGYAPSTHPTFHDRNDPFKFVVFHGLMRYGRYRAMVSIFDSGRTKTDDTWETEQVIYSDDRVFYHLPLVSASSSYPSCFYLRGMLHWIQISCILVFCLDTHTLGLIELPVQSGILPGGGCLWESEGRLHYCQIYPSHDIGLCIWVLDEHPGAVLKGSIQASDWRKIFGLSQQKFNSMLTEAGRRPFTSTTRVCAFDERLLMIHLETPQAFCISVVRNIR
ncbi:hypothetical protein H6P81_000884 [Aristolochia fimbriata]|uniref:F-box protein n=1 Tax=Aristolochia fimbriata TaxID=158543 RepID=A0AAV7F974_ARIFI|nr:hypothetical protein H6P81_000884 [Aristolochia fimbriata]